MKVETILQIISLAFVTLMTPGPNNLMLMASGTNFGIKRTLPHAIGVVLGFSLMVVGVWLGMMNIFEAWPWTQKALRIVSTIYLIYLAYKIATVSPAIEVSKTSKPFKFYQAVLFQWVNPKAWSMSIGAVSLFAPDGALSSVVLLSSIFLCIAIISSSTWTLLGVKLQKLNLKETHIRVFNVVMGLLLIFSIF